MHQRYSSSHGFGADHERASEEGKKGGRTQPGESGARSISPRILLTSLYPVFADHVYKPSEHDGLREDGQPDKRLSSEHGFGADRGGYSTPLHDACFLNVSLIFRIRSLTRITERASEMGKIGGSHNAKDSESDE